MVLTLQRFDKRVKTDFMFADLPQSNCCGDANFVAVILHSRHQHLSGAAGLRTDRAQGFRCEFTTIAITSDKSFTKDVNCRLSPWPHLSQCLCCPPTNTFLFGVER